MAVKLIYLENAVRTLDTAYFADRSEIKDQEIQELLKVGVIRYFDYCYDLSWKFLKRVFQETLSSPDMDLTTYNTLIRTAAEFGIVDNPENWFKYRELRHMPAEEFVENGVERVYPHLPNFIEEVKVLLLKLKAFYIRERMS